MDLVGDLDEGSVNFEVPNLSPDKKVFADYIRNILNIPLNTQNSWFKDSKHYTFFK